MTSTRLTDRTRNADPDVPGERGAAIGRGVTWLATWSWRLVAIAAAAVVLGWLVGRLWSVLLPIALGLLLRRTGFLPDAFWPRRPSA